MKDDQWGCGGYCLGGYGDTDTFGGMCEKCRKCIDVVMDPDNYDPETLDGFRRRKFMVDMVAYLNAEAFDPPV